MWIISLITNERYAGLRATTDSGIEGKIGIDDIRDKYTTPPEKLKSIARVNMSEYLWPLKNCYENVNQKIKIFLLFHNVLLNDQNQY